MCSVFLFLSFHSSLELLILSMCAVFASLIALLCIQNIYTLRADILNGFRSITTERRYTH